MPVARVSQARYAILHNKIANAFATNQRTQVSDMPVIVELPVLRPIDNSLVYATHIAALNTQDWVSGDFFTLRWRKQPGKISTAREVKFIIPQEDGVPWQYLIVLGTVDI